jgi:hypothetical protein
LAGAFFAAFLAGAFFFAAFFFAAIVSSLTQLYTKNCARKRNSVVDADRFFSQTQLPAIAMRCG